MIRAGRNHGNIRIADRCLVPADKKVVIAGLRGWLTVKGMRTIQGLLHPMLENEHFEVMKIPGDSKLQSRDAVTGVIRPVADRKNTPGAGQGKE